MRRNADSMSVFARKHPWPRLKIPWIALSIVIYWRLKSSLGIEELILVSPDFGKDKWKMVLNLVECFLGTDPMGDTWKLGSSGLGKGPATRPRATSLERFSETVFGWERAVGRFLENLATRLPVKPTSAPYLRLLHNFETNSWSGWLVNVSSSCRTLIGVGRGQVVFSLSMRGTWLWVSMVIISISPPFPLWLPDRVGRVVNPWVRSTTFVTYMSEIAGVAITCATHIVKVACASVCAPCWRDTSLGSIGKKRILFFEYRWWHSRNG